MGIHKKLYSTYYSCKRHSNKEVEMTMMQILATVSVSVLGCNVKTKKNVSPHKGNKLA
jgi:hypothetical protein